MTARCVDCGRRRTGDRRFDHWLTWCWRTCETRRQVKHRRRGLWRIIRWQPLWFRYQTRCMGGYDCPGDTYGHNIAARNWHTRRAYRKAAS